MSTVLFLSLLLLTVPAVWGQYDRSGPQHQITWGRGNTPTSAVFGMTPTNVSAVVEHKARLPCIVKNLGHKDVSWIRQRDLHILTVATYTYTTDDRFKVFHQQDTEQWDLVISSVTFRDAGVYECQVSTSPKASLPITLNVLEVQQAVIPGPKEVYIQTGSTISLACEVPAGSNIVGNIRWILGANTLNYSSPRGGISTEVEKTPDYTLSKLYITRARRRDSGNYTCAPEFARPYSVLVHVVYAGEESAAAVQSSAETLITALHKIWLLAILVAIWNCGGPATCLQLLSPPKKNENNWVTIKETDQEYSKKYSFVLSDDKLSTKIRWMEGTYMGNLNKFYCPYSDSQNFTKIIQ